LIDLGCSISIISIIIIVGIGLGIFESVIFGLIEE